MHQSTPKSYQIISSVCEPVCTGRKFLCKNPFSAHFLSVFTCGQTSRLIAPCLEILHTIIQSLSCYDFVTLTLQREIRQRPHLVSGCPRRYTTIRLSQCDIYTTQHTQDTLNLWVSAVNPSTDTSLIKLLNDSNRIVVPHKS